MEITKANFADLYEILELQYLAYQSEAKLLNNYSIQPLQETLPELEEQFFNSLILKAVDDRGRIIGSVRGKIKDNVLLIGKLMVHPDCQGQGIGRKLLAEIEKQCPQPRFELFTSMKSPRNLNFYAKMGYVKFKEEELFGSPFAFLEKYAQK